MKNQKNQNKNQKTFNLNVKGYSLVINVSKGNSNYNTFGHIIRGKEKTPLIGTPFKDGTEDNDIINWANKRLEKYLSEDENSFDLFGQMT